MNIVVSWKEIAGIKVKRMFNVVVIVVKEKALANTVPAAFPTPCANKSIIILMLPMLTAKLMISSIDPKCNRYLLAERKSEQAFTSIYYKNNFYRRFSF